MSFVPSIMLHTEPTVPPAAGCPSEKASYCPSCLEHVEPSLVTLIMAKQTTALASVTSPSIAEQHARLRALEKSLDYYLPNSSITTLTHATEPWESKIRIFCEAEKANVLQCAAELGVSQASFSVVIDPSIPSMMAFFLAAPGTIEVALREPTGRIAAGLAASFVIRGVLDATIEFWDSIALAGVAGASGSGTSTPCHCFEIRVRVPKDRLAAAAAFVREVNDALPHPRLHLSAVIGAEEDLAGGFPALSSGPTLHALDVPCPASHPEFPLTTDAIISTVDLSAVAVAADVAAADTEAVRLTDDVSHGFKLASRGFLTPGAYVVNAGVVYVVSAGHTLPPGDLALGEAPLGRFFLEVPGNPLVLVRAVNPPVCSDATTFEVAESSDFIPGAVRIGAADAPLKVRAVMRDAHADVSIFRLDRAATTDELDMVPLPVHARFQPLLVKPLCTESFLGLPAYDDSSGSLFFCRLNSP